jgi:hypothetical protein
LSSIDIIWRDTGTNMVTVTGTFQPGDPDVILIADIVLNVESGASTVSGVGLSFVVDQPGDPRYSNELTVLGVREFSSVNLPGMGNVFNPLLIGTSTMEGPDGPALIELFDQGTLDTGATGPSISTLGSIKFKANVLRGTPGGGIGNEDLFVGLPDVIPLVQLNGFDGIADETGNRCIGVLPRGDCPYAFNGAYVNAPEPTTSALVIVGLGLGLLYSRRR